MEQIVAATAELFCQPIHDLTVTSYADGTFALVGDAGAVARPHAGAGVGKALDDSFALVDALDAANDTRAALAAYDAERLRIGNELVETGRRLGEILVVHPLDWDRISGTELQAEIEACHERSFEITAEHPRRARKRVAENKFCAAGRGPYLARSRALLFLRPYGTT